MVDDAPLHQEAPTIRLVFGAKEAKLMPCLLGFHPQVIRTLRMVYIGHPSAARCRGKTPDKAPGGPEPWFKGVHMYNGVSLVH